MAACSASGMCGISELMLMLMLMPRKFKAAVHGCGQKRFARCRTVTRPSVRDDGPGFTPNIQIALSPSDGSQPKPNWAWELLVGNHSIDGGSAQAGDPHHRWHAQENRRRIVSSGGIGCLLIA